jgi:hypothetical protein
MADQLLHLAFPYRLGATVEQDTFGELASSALVIALTPRGHRDDLPSFGTTPTVFTEGAVDTGRLAAELTASDERLDVDATETLDLANATVREINAQIQT